MGNTYRPTPWLSATNDWWIYGDPSPIKAFPLAFSFGARMEKRKCTVEGGTTVLHDQCTLLVDEAS